MAPSSSKHGSRHSDFAFPELSDRRMQMDMVKMMKESSKRPPDPTVIDSFASAIDDIIKGSSKSKRGRSKSKPEKTSVLCEQCGATFTSVGNLNRHRRVSHQGIRVHCNFKGCKQTFSQTADLTRHRRRVHHQEN